ncbi:MAG: hypothetical protein Kow0074_20490 [Candidatus Zixiibacteriota bacterium]
MAGNNQFDYYSQAEAYDIAFDFRDLDLEADALDRISVRYRGGTPQSFVDIGCGPGYHAIHYASRGLRAVGIDVNPSMIEYARNKAERLGAGAMFIQADMRDFLLPQPVDLAFCAIASIHYMLTNEDMIRHLRTVARNLTDGGLYLFEANHPRDVFNVGTSTKNEWESVRNGVTVRTRWGVDEEFDPITQISKSHVHMEIERKGETTSHDFTNIDRVHTHQELKLLIAHSGVFEDVAWLGALDPDRPFDNSKDSWRMIPVLRKL